MYQYWRFIFLMFAPNLNNVFILLLDIVYVVFFANNDFAEYNAGVIERKGSGILVQGSQFMVQNELAFKVSTQSSHPPAGNR
jgi:hypothetical protein